MTPDEGGGASPSTQWATGSSTGTDVSLHAHLVGLIAADRALTDERFKSAEAMAVALRAADIEAVKKAFTANESLTQAHNGLLRKMELLVETFPTREALDRRLGAVSSQLAQEGEAMDARFKRLEAWQSKMTGAGLLLAAVGLGNFVKVWTG
jgi:hypothetical protein